MSSNDDEKEEEMIVPFEWLTNFSSLSKLLDPNFLFNDVKDEVAANEQTCQPGGNGQDYNEKDTTRMNNLKVLHIGCGSSTLGENLMRRFQQYDTVINVDNDETVLRGMSSRWTKLFNKWGSNGEERFSTCLWKHLDFNNVDVSNDGALQIQMKNSKDSNDESLEDFQIGRNYFDLVVDKSTLDCALCSDDATSGLIYNAYNALQPNGGVYFVISFHHADLILPMLEDCPGLNWDVRHFIVPRKVDSPSEVRLQNRTYRLGDDLNSECTFEEMTASSLQEHCSERKHHSSWSNSEGIFKPDDSYGKFVNVFICKRHLRQEHDNVLNHLDRNAMRLHIHDCNDLHYKNHNPMVTHVRKEQIKQSFLEHLQTGDDCTLDDCHKLDNGKLGLRVCYDILFTAAEKEHLTYDYFLEDYDAFLEEQKSSRDNLESGMTLNQAIIFLETMQ